MLEKLDPYTTYYTEEGSQELKMMITGKYAGIGSLIRFHDKKNTTVIAEPYDNMPAAKAGLRIGDAILSINGIDIHGMSSDSASNMLRGEPGTKLTVKVERPGVKKPITVNIERASIALPPIPYYGILKDSIGYIQLSTFTENCSKDMRRAIIDLKGQGAKSFIIDLRSNGGGSLQESVNIVNLFVPKGKTIVTTKGKTKKSNEEYKTSREPIDTESPLIILVNGQTASASEILAGSLQDFDRAVVIGSRTFGKGLVQSTRTLPGNGYLKLTTAKYYIPSGRCVQALDYSHRHEDGRAQRIPDSLTNVFYTAAGREVRDGGGIRPDLQPKGEELSTLLYYLIQDMTVFDFATEYKLKHEKIAPAETFELDDESYAQFTKMLKESGFNYDMQSGKILKDLKEMIEFEGYADITKEDIASLEKKLQHNLDHALTHFSKHVKQLISDEIVKRYYGQKGEIIYNLRDDTDLEESFRILENMERYKEILSPQKKAVTKAD
jgi:carboxyl-terminal processing protease